MPAAKHDDIEGLRTMGDLVSIEPDPRQRVTQQRQHRAAVAARGDPQEQAQEGADGAFREA